MARSLMILPALSLVMAVSGAYPAFTANVKVLDPMPVMILTGYSEAQQFRAPSSVFIDRRRGDIWVADTGNHQIVEFDSTGVPVTKFRHMSIDQETGEATPGAPVSVVVDSLGQVYVTDGTSDRISQYDYRGRLIKRIDAGKLLGLDKARIGWLRVDDKDNLYFVEGDTMRLVVLNRDLALVRTVNLKQAKTAGAGQGQTDQAVSCMDITTDGKVYLLDADYSPCVRVLDRTGKELLAFGDIDAGWDNFQRPLAVVGIDDGTFWVADGDSSIVKQYTSDGKYQQYIGGGPGSRPGEMRYPIALATDGKSKLFVAEKVTNRVQVFALK